MSFKEKAMISGSVKYDQSSNSFWKFFGLFVLGVVSSFLVANFMLDRQIFLWGALILPFIVYVLLRWPDLATLLVVFYLYTNIGPVAIKFHGMPAMVVSVFPLILVIPLVWYLFFLREKIIITPVFIVLLILAGVYLIGSALSSDIKLSFPQLTEFILEGLLMYFLLTNVIRTPEMLKRVVWTLLISGALIGGLSLYQQVTQTFDNNYGGFAQVQSDFGTGVSSSQGEVAQPRLAGSIGEKNRYAQLMLMLVPLGLFQLWIYRSTVARVLALIMTGLIIIGGALSFSRGAAVGFVLMISIMVVLRYIKISQLLLLVLGVSLIFWMFPQYGTRLTTLNVVAELATPDSGPALAGADNAVVDRASLMLSSFMIFLDHPVIGVGPGMVKYYTQEYAKQIGISSITGDYQAHNLYVGILAEVGLLGSICFATVLFLIMRDLAVTRKKFLINRPDLSFMATAFFQMIISYLVTGLFLHLSYYRFFYLMLALAVTAGSFRHIELAEVIDEPKHD